MESGFELEGDARLERFSVVLGGTEGSIRRAEAEVESWSPGEEDGRRAKGMPVTPSSALGGRIGIERGAGGFEGAPCGGLPHGKLALEPIEPDVGFHLAEVLSLSRTNEREWRARGEDGASFSLIEKARMCIMTS